MTDFDPSQPNATLLADLRAQAERVLRGEPRAGEDVLGADATVLHERLERLEHELHVHQTELRLQMEQLIQSNADLERARDEYQDLFDFAPIGYVTLDRSSLIVRANLTASQQFAQQREALLRRRFTAFVAPQHATTFALFLRRVFDTSEKQAVEVALLDAKGESFFAKIEAIATRDEHDQPTRCRLAIVDITAQRVAQEEVLRLNATLEERVQRRTAHIQQLNDEIEEFAYAVTHDLQTPLRHIRDFTTFLREGAGRDAAFERNAHHVLHSVGRMDTMLRGLLEFFRASRQRLRFQDVDLGRVLREVHKDLAPRLEGRHVNLTVEKLPVVPGDPSALQVIFLNLLDNALAFTWGRDGAWVRVSARETEREFVVQVQDNGVGFNVRQKGKLFGMFQRLHSERDFEGTGVGLAIVRRVVLRHGGRVWADGTPGKGATFYVALPKQAPHDHD